MLFSACNIDMSTIARSLGENFREGADPVLVNKVASLPMRVVIAVCSPNDISNSNLRSVIDQSQHLIEVVWVSPSQVNCMTEERVNYAGIFNWV